MPITVRPPSPNVIQDNVALPPKVPQLPEDVFERFPSLRTYQEAHNKWWVRASVAIQQFAGAVGDEVDETSGTSGDLFVTFNDFTAAITTQVDAIANEQGAQARRIVTVSAMAGISSNIKVQTTAPVGPVLNDYWIDNSVIADPITYKWDGASWIEVTTPIAFAGVAAESTARASADGFLASKYTLTVIAGDVVTGMNITSASGPGTNISSVIFRASDFKIYNGTTGITMFTVSGSVVNLAGVLTVSTSGKVFIGVGTYANTNTPWYVDSSSNFSLGDKFTWNGTLLTVVSGVIGGFTLTSTTLTAGTGATFMSLSNDAGTGLKLGDTSAQNLLLRRSTGGATGLYIFQSGSSSTRVGLECASSGNGRLTLSDSSGNLKVDLDAGHSVAQATFNVPIQLDNARSAGLPVAGGTLTVLDSTGATRQLLCV